MVGDGADGGDGGDGWGSVRLVALDSCISPDFSSLCGFFFLQHSSLCSRVHIAAGVGQQLSARQPGAAYAKGKQNERFVWRAVDQGETKNKTQIVGFVLFFLSFIFFSFGRGGTMRICLG